MKYHLLFIAFFTVSASAYCQQVAYEQDMSNSIRIFDNTGKIFENPNSDVEGSPYLMDAWKPGFVVLNNSKKYPRKSMRLDVQKHELHYLAENNIEMMLPAELVRAFTLVDSGGTRVTEYHFQSGFPTIDSHGMNFYYEVLSSGKLTMLHATSKQVKIDKNPLSGDVKKAFQQEESYYFYQPDIITKLKRDKDFVLAAMKDHSNEITTFLGSHKISFKSTQDIKTLVDYYNSLP